MNALQSLAKKQRIFINLNKCKALVSLGLYSLTNNTGESQNETETNQPSNQRSSYDVIGFSLWLLVRNRTYTD